MLFKTRGIVVNYIKYRESSIITSIFTEEFGLQSYIVNSVRSKKSKNKIAYFQPLTLLDLVVYKNDKKNIQRISEFKNAHAYIDLPFNPQKSSISIFLSEVLSKSLSTEEDQKALFEFVFSAFIYLDITPTKEVVNFHLQFLFHLCFHLGVYAKAEEILDQVELKLGFTQKEKEDCIKTLAQLQNLPFTSSVSLTLYERRLAFSSLVAFLQENFSSLRNLKSIDVIREMNA